MWLPFIIRDLYITFIYVFIENIVLGYLLILILQFFVQSSAALRAEP